MKTPTLCLECVTPELLDLLNCPSVKQRKHPIAEGPLIGWFIQPHIDAAKAISEICDMAVALDAAPLDCIADHLHPWAFTALVLVCGCRFGLEKTEKIMGWPARSGKLILAMTLDDLIRAAVL
ncbi:MAG: hypothetical protein COB16_05955 [Rhodobacteraceae bacterium]|nr:MAG: hypothetical protein COB16_05955 [Paracoccaceae bacterium]